MTADGKKIAGTRAAFLNAVIHRQVKHPARLLQAPFVALVKYVYVSRSFIIVIIFFPSTRFKNVSNPRMSRARVAPPSAI